MYNTSKRIEWDPHKAESNFRKHKIRFSDAESVLFDPFTLTIQDQNRAGEQRFVSIGADAFHRVLVVVYAHRGENIRLLSARRATRKERNHYEEGI